MFSKVDFYQSIERFDDRVALIASDQLVTYEELAARADQYGRNLGTVRSLVFVEARNEVASIAAYLGALRAGHAVYLFGEGDRSWLESLVQRYCPAVILRHDGEAMVVERVDASGPVALHPKLKVLLSTSGSTGSPKFVKLSDRNLCANAAAVCEYLELTANDRAITSLKFHYSYGLSVLHTHLAVGAALILTDSSVNDPTFWKTFAQHQGTSFAGVPYTFELLSRYPGWEGTAGLRYVTQAGGKLSPDMVQRLARTGEAHDWKFFVMYGQTEAAPRMAWLPPCLASRHPDCIGVPVPGGSLVLLDSNGGEIAGEGVQGELAYRGPNVMMGYARSHEDLVSDETPDQLMTGDIAERVPGGLYRIVGRAARIVKPFGMRLNLDEFQALVRGELPDAVCTGTDERIVVATTSVLDAVGRDRLQKAFARTFRLPQSVLEIICLPVIPTLSSHKPDYQAILSWKHSDASTRSYTTWRAYFVAATRLGSSARLYRRAFVEARAVLGLGAPEWTDVQSIYASLASAGKVHGTDSYQSLAGDSLSYVQTSLALEEYLGHLPEGWDELTVEQLEASRSHEIVL
jgi:hypothetical protein